MNEKDKAINDLAEQSTLDYQKIVNIQFEGIDHKDSPDYSDAYIVSAEYCGEEMTEEQLEQINDDKDFVHEQLMNYLY